MRTKNIFSAILTLIICLPSFSYAEAENPQEKQQIEATKVVIETNLGLIKLALLDKKTPQTVANFLAYIDESFYNGTIFHRVIPGFMIQGGGFQSGMIKKTTKLPIKNEAQAFIPNKRGSIAMARTNDPDSATAQFFINVNNNPSLNKSASQAGYAVFGEVIEGMDVVDRITATKTVRKGSYADVPAEDVVIIKMSRL